MEALTTVGPELAASLIQKRQVSSELHDVAEQFEALFIQQILKQGRSAKLADDRLTIPTAAAITATVLHVKKDLIIFSLKIVVYGMLAINLFFGQGSFY